MVKVARVHPGSIAEELGILPGTALLSVNGRQLDDFLDWEFLTAEDTLEIEATLPDGESVVYDVERPENEPMGLELEPPTVRRCANRCVTVSSCHRPRRSCDCSTRSATRSTPWLQAVRCCCCSTICTGQNRPPFG